MLLSLYPFCCSLPMNIVSGNEAVWAQLGGHMLLQSIAETQP